MQDDRRVSHGFDHILGNHSLNGKTEEEVGTLHGICKVFIFLVSCKLKLLLIQTFAALVDVTAGVEHGNVSRLMPRDM